MTDRQHRRYPKATKAALVLLADQSSISAAAEAGGVPRKTLEYWLDRPEFAELRLRAREQMAEDVLTTAKIGWARLAERLPDMDDGDLIDAVELATTKGLLLSGEATSRTEHRDLTADLPDHERQALADVIDAWLAETADADSTAAT
jgi:transposase-like protein